MTILNVLTVFKKALKKIQTIYFCLKKIDWRKAYTLYNKEADIILWYYPLYRKNIFTQSIERDFAFINAFVEQNLPFKVFFGKNIGKYSNKKIFYSVTKYYDGNGFKNYAMILYHISKQLEEQSNIVYPTSHETLLWENKLHMHKQFNDLNINQPKTVFISQETDLSKIELDYPFLIKEPHSSSSMGLYKVNSLTELHNLINTKKPFSRNNALLAQKIIDMRKDVRVILVGDKIMLHYWRINLSNEWKPTATGYGSKVDFEFFPNKWEDYIKNEFKKLNITTGGFDVTWDKDDLEKEPYFLEISPFYQPNPKADMTNVSYSYGEYKKKFKLINSWDKIFVDVVFELQSETVSHFLNKHA
ncbi:RimK family alpha-L-glutamate ligase [Geojedonia litorea]|uniref:RimK family alpha-L-glutamate ligase n=1 Tax=Geojedonia litorea TaxID=1268269 RepID=A0ABV9N5L5_9FLAO